MKNFQMNYGDKSLGFSLDEKNILQIIESNEYINDKSEEKVIEEAIKNPIGSPRLKELVHPGETVCVVIPDATRTWQKTYKFLYKIVDELNEGGVDDKDILFISALGTHRKQTEEEHRQLLGEKLSARFKVMDHDCYDKDNLKYMGQTTYGTPVWINKKALECDHIVLTGGIVYHFLVGWSGGKKYVLPGISSYETVMANHALSLSPKMGGGTHPNVRSGNIVNNPVHEDMLQAAAFVKPTFMFNVVMGPDGNIAGAVAGNYIEAHAKGRKLVDKIDGVQIKEKADVVIATAGGYPKDINLYQSIKTFINAREAAKEGGTIIAVTECREGLGGNEEVQNMILNYNTLLDREKALREDYSISKFVGYYVCETAEKFNFILVSKLDPKLVEKANITVVDSIEKALDLVKKTKGDNLSVHLMPHAANTFPKL
ncbi:nickel-dependent lactate racemase [Haloimpatiens sp. FM7330]|uniref:nickel-dependent lactate racemase n=1 Tax=Haloimpatiens sp. FM7330 TaxID=3298610 RepID=UPI003632D999